MTEQTAVKVSDVGIGGEVQKYYPILFMVKERDDEPIRYYLEDVQAWAVGDISGIVGREREVIMGLAQNMLDGLERTEVKLMLGGNLASAKRIESREQEVHHGD